MFEIRNLLGIYIPTYNRPNLLKKSLKSIITSIKYANAIGIPIYISDNSTNEETSNLINELKKDYPYIFYEKNEKNIGLDRNIWKVLNLGDTTFSWLMGDDDLLKKESIKYILPILKKILNKNINFVFVNYSYIDNNYKYIIKKKVLNLTNDQILDSQVFFCKYVWAIGFIGSCIIKRCCIKKEKCKYLGMFFPHIGIILECSKGKKIYMVEKSLVLNRSENIKSSTWGKKAFEVYYGFEKTLWKLERYYGKNIIELALNNSKVLFKHRSLIWIASKRGDGIYNFFIWKNYILNNKEFSIFKKFLALLVAIFPKFLFKLLKFFFKTLPQKIKRDLYKDNED